MLDLPCGSFGLYKSREKIKDSLDFTRLPKSMRFIYLSENRFSGTFDLGNLPESLAFFDVSENTLSGRVRVRQGLIVELDGNEQLTMD